MITRVRSALVCDDVRQEDNGKTLLIGVYGKDLHAGEKPAMLRLYLHIAFDVDADENEIDLRMCALSESIQRINLKAVHGYCTLTAGVTIALTEPRVFKVDVRNPGGDWIDCGEWQMAFAEDAEDSPPDLAEHIRRAAQQMADG